MKGSSKEWQAVYELHGALDKKFAQDIVLLDLRQVSTVADFFIIATGASRPQMEALAETSKEILAKHDIPLHHIEGLKAGEWVLLDFGGVIVHLFDKENRDFYKLERVWGDAKMIELA